MDVSTRCTLHCAVHSGTDVEQQLWTTGPRSSSYSVVTQISHANRPSDSLARAPLPSSLCELTSALCSGALLSESLVECQDGLEQSRFPGIVVSSYGTKAIPFG